MNKDPSLLRPFVLALAADGNPICWSHLNEEVTFVGGMHDRLNIAVRDAIGYVEVTDATSLRMKPLFWYDGKPVYKGDRLWHTISRKWIIVDRLQSNPDAEQKGHFYSTDGSRRDAALCRFKEPPEPLFILEGKPVNKGDRLWHNRDNHWVTVAGILDTGNFLDENGTSRSPYYCTWEKPKTTVVRYANVYADLPNGKVHTLGELYPTPDGPKDAFSSEKPIGIARIEWQE